jgi:hypothetical protein
LTRFLFATRTCGALSLVRIPDPSCNA